MIGHNESVYNTLNRQTTVSPNPLVEVKDLSFQFRDSQDPALQNLNLNLNPGETILLTGASGSGKSTLSLCLNGLIPHLIKGQIKGQIVVAGMQTSKRYVSEMSTKVGIVFQDPENQLSNLYVRDEIAFGCENLCLSVDEIKERVEHYASLLNLSHLKDTFCNHLSGGQKQRVALASVLAMEPQLLILDEPTSNLDNSGTYNLIQSLKILREKTDITILIIEHKIDEFIHLVDKVVVIEKGQILCQGTPREVYTAYGNQLRFDMGAWVPQIVEMGLILNQEKSLSLTSLPLTIDEAHQLITENRLTLTSNAASSTNTASSPQVPPPLFELENLYYSYDKKTNILNNVNLIIKQGEVIVITGPNGSGKTTLGKLLMGLLKFKQGKIFYQKKNITKLSLSQLASQVGYVFQNVDAPFIKETVLEEVCHSLQYTGKPEADILEAATHLLDRYGLLETKDLHPLNLSIGQKRSLSLAILAPFPLKALILDEPSMGLDYIGTTRLMNLLHEKKRKGTAIIMITHEMRFLTDFVDRVIVLEAGSVKADVSPYEFFSSSELLDFLSVVEPPVVTLSKKLKQASHQPEMRLALTPQAFCARLQP